MHIDEMHNASARNCGQNSGLEASRIRRDSLSQRKGGNEKSKWQVVTSRRNEVSRSYYQSPFNLSALPARSSRSRRMSTSTPVPTHSSYLLRISVVIQFRPRISCISLETCGSSLVVLASLYRHRGHLTSPTWALGSWRNSNRSILGTDTTCTSRQPSKRPILAVFAPLEV